MCCRSGGVPRGTSHQRWLCLGPYTTVVRGGFRFWRFGLRIDLSQCVSDALHQIEPDPHICISGACDAARDLACQPGAEINIPTGLGLLAQRRQLTSCTRQARALKIRTVREGVLDYTPRVAGPEINRPAPGTSEERRRLLRVQRTVDRLLSGEAPDHPVAKLRSRSPASSPFSQPPPFQTVLCRAF